MKSLTKFFRKTAPFLAVASGEPQRLADLAGLEIGQTDADVDRLAMDLLGGLGGNGLDLDASFGGGHQHRALEVAVDRQAQVELAGDVVAHRHQHLGNRLTRCAGLIRDQRLAQQACRSLLGLGGRLHELHTLGHALGTRLLAAGDLQRQVAVDLGADRDPLAPPPAWTWALTTIKPPPSAS